MRETKDHVETAAAAAPKTATPVRQPWHAPKFMLSQIRETLAMSGGDSEVTSVFGS